MAIFSLTVVLIGMWHIAYCQSEYLHVELDGHNHKLINLAATSASCGAVKVAMARASNMDSFITSDLRFNLCKSSYERLGKTFESDFSKKCFADDGHISSKLNPCFLVCQEKSKLSNERNSDDCDSSDQTGERFLLTDYPCGHNHVCDSNGCCVATLHKTTDDTSPTPTTTDFITVPLDPETTTPEPETTTTEPETPETESTTPEPEITTPEPEITTPEPETPETESTTPEPETTTTESETPETETTTTESETPETESTTPEPETTTPEPETTTPETETSATPIHELETVAPVIDKMKNATKFHCDTVGYFPHENKNHFYHCKWFITLHICDEDELFSKNVGGCLFDQTIEDPSLELNSWNRGIRCSREGTFRSPYNCEYFYQCVQVEVGFNLYFFHCNEGLVFDETIQQCTYKTHRCNNKLVLPTTIH